MGKKYLKKYLVNIQSRRHRSRQKWYEFEHSLTRKKCFILPASIGPVDRVPRNLPIGESGSFPFPGSRLALGPVEPQFMANGMRSALCPLGGVSTWWPPRIPSISSPNRAISARFGPVVVECDTIVHSGLLFHCRRESIHICRQVLHENKSRWVRWPAFGVC